MSKGFTLLEVTICILVLGLAVNGLFNLLVWANKRYTTTLETSENLISEYEYIRIIRKEITEGKFLLAANDQNSFKMHLLATIKKLNTHLINKNIKIASFSIRLYNKNTYFVKLDILNKISRKITPRVVVYNIR